MDFHTFFHCQISIQDVIACAQQQTKYTCKYRVNTTVRQWHILAYCWYDILLLLYSWSPNTCYIGLGSCYHLYCHRLNLLYMQLSQESRLLNTWICHSQRQETLLPLCLKSITAQQQLPSGTWQGSRLVVHGASLHPWLLYSIDLLVCWNVTRALDKHNLLGRESFLPMKQNCLSLTFHRLSLDVSTTSID